MMRKSKKSKDARAKTGSTAVSKTRKAGARGFAGRGLGEAKVLHPMREMRGTNYQVCGLYPFPMGGGSPISGVPLGRNLITGEPVCCDPITWFMKLRLIANPSAFLMANPGLGKSSVIRRMCMGLSAFGTIPMVLGDIKGEHVLMIRKLGGAVLELGRGVGQINPLDDFGAMAIARKLSPARREELLTELHDRRRGLVASLIAIQRKEPLNERERNILDRCLSVLEEEHGEDATEPPEMKDLLRVLKARPEQVRAVALDRGSDERYDEITEGLEGSFNTLCGAGSFGRMFAGQSTDRIDPTRPMVFDLSRIPQSDSDLRAATLMTCWTAGFSVVTASNMAADDGLIQRRRYFMVLDELWNTLAAGRGLVDEVNALTRLNREWGVGMVMASHTPSDLMAVRDENDRHKAKGILNRCGMKILGGLARAEMPLLTQSVSLSQREQDQLANWQDPAAWTDGRDGDIQYTNDDVFTTTTFVSDAAIHEWLEDSDEAEWVEDDRTRTPPPGQGKFLIKVGSRAGIPVSVDLTPTERSSGVHDTERKWHTTKKRMVKKGGSGGAL